MSEEKKVDDRPRDCPITKVGMDGIAVESMVPHEWHWLWVHGVMTNKVQCGTCNKIEVRHPDGHGTVAA